MLQIDKSYPEDIQILVKACYHLTNKAYPHEGGFRVPAREFERVRAKVRKLVEHV